MAAQSEIKIRDFYGKILGTITTSPNGDKTVKDFYGKTLGTYNKNMDVTKDFYGKTVANGDACTMLIGMSK